MRVLAAKDGPVGIKVSRVSSGASDRVVLGLGSRMLGRGHGSEQLPWTRQDQATWGMFNVEVPPVSLEGLEDLSHNEPMHYACIEAKAHAVGGQGYRIRPASELVLSEPTVAQFRPREEAPDELQRDAVLAFLESSLPDFSFSETLIETHRDVEALGQGFIEVVRALDEGALPKALYPCKAISMRILADNTGYVQSRGGQYRVYSKYKAKGPRYFKVEQGGKYSWQDSDREEQSGFRLHIGGWTERGSKEFVPGESLDVLGMRSVGVTSPDTLYATNQMMMFRKGSTRDTLYGTSDIVAAQADALGAQYAALFNLDYFQNNAVPRMAVVVQGGEMSEEVEEKLESWLAEQSAASVANSVVVLQVQDANTEVRFEKLGTVSLGDTDVDKYRQGTDEHIRFVHRVPLSVIAGGDQGAADFIFNSQVVRPAQRMYETRINYMLREDFGITDWVVDIMVPDLMGEQQRATIYEILLRRGVVTIDEVRAVFGLAGIKGGDVAFILVPGAGAVPVETLLAVVEGRLSGNVAGSGMKTPSTEAPVYQPPKEVQQALSKLRIILNEDAVDIIRALPSDQAAEMETICETLGMFAETISRGSD